MAFKTSGSRKNAVLSDINITPMLDLAYVLLVTFIIMTTASVQGAQDRLPLSVVLPAT